MASDTVIGSAEREAAPAARTPAAAPPRVLSKPRRGRFSPLTGRILGVNILALAMLGVGLLYVGRYESSLIDTELIALQTQGEIFAAALGEGAVLDSFGEGGQRLVPVLARQMTQRLVEPTRTRVRLFDAEGNMIGDSRMLRGHGVVQIRELPPPVAQDGFKAKLDAAYDWLFGSLPRPASWPPYVEKTDAAAADYPEVLNALAGEKTRAVREDRAADRLMLTVAVPVQRYKHVLGAVLLSVSSDDIEQAVRAVRFDILRAFLIALAVTTLLSFYLAGTIARPIRRLAAAAERVRRGSGRQMAIPDLTRRGDEIGDLSGALREMTSALWQRMDAIERFAADVAHEIKNPLTSLRSAVETAARIEDPAKRQKLLGIVMDDVKRLDRLISDISDASRLDAELSRIEPQPVDVGRVLGTLADLHDSTRDEDSPRLVLALSSGDLVVPGSEGRLVQVFRNLIGNAVSFSPEGGTIRLAARRDESGVVVVVEDEGPGIPEGKLAAIFDRFYTERPSGEKFGTHSGLGLSISKQIVEAHGGIIRAENLRDEAGRVAGARFVVRLPT
jgi:two-component system, OmpR family, sensor histidine kinase ChvG